MTVRDLILALHQYPLDYEVTVAAACGERCKIAEPHKCGGVGLDIVSHSENGYTVQLNSAGMQQSIEREHRRARGKAGAR